jgi:hypothetical protein
MHRQAINNSTFQNEYDIGKAVSNRTVNYNKKQEGCKTTINSLKRVSIRLHRC